MVDLVPQQRCSLPLGGLALFCFDSVFFIPGLFPLYPLASPLTLSWEPTTRACLPACLVCLVCGIKLKPVFFFFSGLLLPFLGEGRLASSGWTFANMTTRFLRENRGGRGGVRFIVSLMFFSFDSLSELLSFPLCLLVWSGLV